MSGITDPSVLLSRARAHAAAGDAMPDQEWAAVCWFYSAYAFMRSAIEADPVWNDPSLLAKASPVLQLADRHTTRHKGRGGRNTREPGVNDIVRMLYPQISPSYEALHQASIAVRYGTGLDTTRLPLLRDRLRQIETAYAAGLRHRVRP